MKMEEVEVVWSCVMMIQTDYSMGVVILEELSVLSLDVIDTYPLT